MFEIVRVAKTCAEDFPACVAKPWRYKPLDRNVHVPSEVVPMISQFEQV